ncbi:MAG: hypothetical protein V2J89_11490 [Halieaceae bacterium]|nr:hypothetical protein [Halieaceae bacterium]
MAILLSSDVLLQLLRDGDLHLESLRALDGPSQRTLQRLLTETVSHNRRHYPA